MKTARLLGTSLITASLLASSVSPAAAVGFDTFQLTYNNQNNHDFSSGGQYVAWLIDTFDGNVEVGFTDILRGRYGQITFDNRGSKKELYVSPQGTLIWVEGSGTSTDVYGYFTDAGINFRLTTDKSNNQKPRIAGNYATWTKTVSGTPHVMVAHVYGGADSGTDLGAGDNPRIVTTASGEALVFYEIANGNINYWDSTTGSIDTAVTPGILCSDNALGEAAAGDGKVSYVKTCLLGDQTYYFDAGADVSDTGDDSNTLVSSGLLTSANTPTMSSSNGKTLVGWVEGSLLSTATIQVKGILGGLLGLLGLGNSSLLNDKVSAAADNVVWQQHNANGTIDILGHNHTTGDNYTVATGATLEGNSPIAEVAGTGSVWGGYLKTANGKKNVHVMVPKITTPVGSNITVSPGNNTSVTYPTVSQAGETTFTTKSLFTSPATPLTGFQLGTIPTYYDVHTTAIWSGTATVCFEYNPGNFNDDESLLQILHVENGNWVDRTLSIDTATHVICAGVNSFSELAFAVRQPTVISSIDVTNVSNIAPQSVTVTGTGFITGPKLSLGGTQLTDVTYVDANTLTATIPAGIAPGKYDLVLSNRYGSGSTLGQAVTVTAPGLATLKTMLAEAGITTSNAPKLYELVAKAEKAIEANNKKEAAKTLKAFKEELERITKTKKKALNFQLVKQAYAGEVKKVKTPSTRDASKIKGAKRIEPTFKNASLKLPKPTITPKPTKKPRIKTDEEKVQAILTYTDGLIEELQGKKTAGLPVEFAEWVALSVAAMTGGGLLMHRILVGAGASSAIIMADIATRTKEEHDAEKKNSKRKKRA